MPFLAAPLLATIPAGASRPTSGVLLTFVVFLVVVIAINACWEMLKGPPSP